MLNMRSDYVSRKIPGASWIVYNPETGKLYRWFKTTGMREVKGLEDDIGYLRAYCPWLKDTAPMQRIIWRIVHGPDSIPEGHYVLHKNGDKHDNRLENLYVTTKRPDPCFTYNVVRHVKNSARMEVSSDE